MYVCIMRMHVASREHTPTLYTPSGQVPPGTTQRNAPQIAADRGEDGHPISPDHNNNNRAKSAICRAQGDAQQAKHGASEQCPGAEQRKRVAWWATHQPDAADDRNQTRAPSKPSPWSLAWPP